MEDLDAELLLLDELIRANGRQHRVVVFASLRERAYRLRAARARLERELTTRKAALAESVAKGYLRVDHGEGEAQDRAIEALELINGGTGAAVPLGSGAMGRVLERLQSIAVGSVPPCPACVSEYGHAKANCALCGGSGVCPSIKSAPSAPTPAPVTGMEPGQRCTHAIHPPDVPHDFNAAYDNGWAFKRIYPPPYLRCPYIQPPHPSRGRTP